MTKKLVPGTGKFIIREKFDYTKWQESLFDNMTPDQINEDMKQYFAENPYKGNAKVVL